MIRLVVNHLDGLLGIIGDFGMRRKDLAHDPYNIGYGHEAILLPNSALIVVDIHVLIWRWVSVSVGGSATAVGAANAVEH